MSWRSSGSHAGVGLRAGRCPDVTGSLRQSDEVELSLGLVLIRERKLR